MSLLYLLAVLVLNNNSLRSSALLNLVRKNSNPHLLSFGVNQYVVVVVHADAVSIGLLFLSLYDWIH